jgi:quercetin dioxygenase-like cupin family protein
MKSHIALHIEELESRDTPAPVTGGVFLPPGIAHAVGDPHLPASAYVGRTGDVIFLPPGLERTVQDPHLPASVHVGPDGSIAFLPPGVIRGFDPQPDPPPAA